MTEHENWIRYYCFRHAKKWGERYRPIEKVIEDAKLIENYVLARPKADVIPLKNVKNDD